MYNTKPHKKIRIQNQEKKMEKWNKEKNGKMVQFKTVSIRCVPQGLIESAEVSQHTNSIAIPWRNGETKALEHPGSFMGIT